MTTQDELEDTLYRPVQRAFGRAKRTHTQFAGRVGLESPAFGSPAAGHGSQGAKSFIERAATAAGEADRRIAELQDSGLAIESGDSELRAGLTEVRELLGPVPVSTRQFLRTLGR